MLRLITFFKLTVLLSGFLATAALAAELPTRVNASYVVAKDGQEIATVTERYEVKGDHYQVESTTKGIGIYALMGVRKLTSTGKVTAQGLKPDHFELHQSNSAKKTLSADFDWTKDTLTMNVKGINREVALSQGTQDLASYAYQFMFLPRPPKDHLTVILTTGKKLNTYEYQNNEPHGTLTVDGKSYKTVHLVPSNQPEGQVETKEMWLAANQQYLLVRFIMVNEDGEKLEQTLTELHVE